MEVNVKNNLINYQNYPNYKNIFCANCGEKGHVVKDCGRPITSFGIIAFKVVNSASDEIQDKNTYLTELVSDVVQSNNYPKIKFLMIQRKDTMGYIDFVRGKYSSNEQERLKKLKVCLTEMTFKEKNNLLTQTFDEIWNNLWINHESKCFKNEYENAKKKFNQLNVKSLVDNSPTVYTFQEFGFAKGRRNMKESNIICAEREFCEETRYDKSTYEFIKNYPAIQEEFVGTNEVKYRHTYYLVKMKDNVRPPKIDFTNKVQTGEVRNIGWFTFQESISLLRPYDIEKRQVLVDVNKDIETMNFNFDCSSYYSGCSARRHELLKSRERQNIYANTENKYLNSEEYLIEGNFI